MNVSEPRHYIPGVRLHLDYVDFGAINWNSTVPEDSNPDIESRGPGGYDAVTGGCVNNNCGQMRQFNSTGRAQALIFTVEPYWSIGHGFTVGVEGGIAAWRGTWLTAATNLTTGGFGPVGAVEDISADNRVRFTPIVGASVGYKSLTMRYDYMATNVYNFGVKSVQMLSVNYAF